MAVGQSGASPIERGNLPGAALWYAQQGFPVFPLRPQSKRPATPNGFKGATKNEETVLRWWQEMPEANIAIPMGKVSGLIALDVDPRHGGDSELERLIAQHEPIPDTAEQTTGGDGRHYLFQHPGEPIRSRDLGHGVELKADGTYILVPPSVHPDSKRLYQWDGIEAEGALRRVAPLPNWIRNLSEETHPRTCRDASQKIREGSGTQAWHRWRGACDGAGCHETPSKPP